MAVIDVQVHAYERNHPGRPWAGHLHGPTSATGEEMLAAMDSVGVDAAIIVSTFNLYRYDPSYALEVYAKYPERFRVVKPIDPADPAVDDVLADWAKTKGAVGVRLMLREEQISDPADPRLNRAFAAAGRHGLPVNFLCWGRLDAWPGLAVALLSIPIMLVLARRKLALADRLGSGALRADAAESIACLWLSVVVVVGLLVQLAFRAWWIDSVTSLAIVWFLVKEGREAWESEEDD